jgi:hypothetical protein
MSINVEKQHGGEFILTESNGTLSRDAIVIVSGQNLIDGFILGKITASSKYKEFDPAAVDGSENAAGVLVGDVDATAGDKEAGAVVWGAEIKEAQLNWKSGLTSNQKIAALAVLAAKRVIARS